MPWYDKLKQYFPVEEMKSRLHIETLLAEKPREYRKDEGPDHVLLYVEFDDLLFVDYVFVSAASRGQGLGRTLIDRLKARGKPILLEVEPLDYHDTDTARRQRFYQRQGFRHASRVKYRRPSLATGQLHPLEILIWSPDGVDDSAVYAAMQRIYAEIHCFRDEKIYGQSYAPVEDVLALACS